MTGHHVPKLVEGERRNVQDQKLQQQHMEVKYVQETQRRLLLAIHRLAQLTVNGDPMAIGHHVQNLAQGDGRPGQEQKLRKHQMEVKNAMGNQQRNRPVMNISVLVTHNFVN